MARRRLRATVAKILSSRWLAAPRAGLAVPFLAVATACSTFDGLSLAKPGAERPAGPCVLASAQQPVPTIGFAGCDEHVVAFSSIDISPEHGTVGFDLDGKCTGEGDGPSCQRPPWADEHDDGPQGRDNSLLASLSKVDAGTALLNSVLAGGINGGFLTTLLRIRDYDGMPNDGNIEVALFAVTLGTGDLDTEGHKPGWNGQDAWKPFVGWTGTPDPSEVGPQVDAGCPPDSVTAKYVSDRAYVVNGVLVAHFRRLLLPTTYLFSDVTIQATIDDGGGQWSLHDGVFEGRLAVDQILPGLDYVSGTDGNLLCTDSMDFLAVKRTICALADIRYADDDISAPCDAASFAWRFDTGAAQLSNDIQMLRPTDFHHCSASTSSASEHCSSLGASQP